MSDYTDPRVELPLTWVVAAVRRNWRTIAATTLAGFVLAVVVAVLRPPMFAARFSFLPQAAQDQARGGLASLAGQFGIPLGVISTGSQPPQLYADLLKTREVLGGMASDTFQISLGGTRRGSLATFLDIESSDSLIRRERTLQYLQTHVVSTSVASRTTGSINVAVRTRSPRVSLEIAEELIARLNQFNRVTRQSQAREERLFIETRLAATRASLRAAEDALQVFLQNNRQFVSPQLKFQQDRLEREVGMQQQVVAGLAQQYEDARIREVRDTPVITLIERPVLPALPEPRRRLMLLILGTALAFGLGITIAVAREGWRRQSAFDNGDAPHTRLPDEWRRGRSTITSV